MSAVEIVVLCVLGFTFLPSLLLVTIGSWAAVVDMCSEFRKKDRL